MARRLPVPGPNPNPVIKDLNAMGALVRNRRYELGLRIDDAAHACGVTASVMSRLENGIAIGADRLLLVINGLGLSLVVTSKQNAQSLKFDLMGDRPGIESEAPSRTPTGDEGVP